MGNNPTSILASFSTMKSMVDAKQYQNQYQILAEFIQYVIVQNSLHSFTAVEMKNRLHEVFGFDVPEAVVRTAVRGLNFIKTENGIHHVEGQVLGNGDFFEEKKTLSESQSDEIISQLIEFANETGSSNIILTDVLTKEFIAYLLDDQQTTSSGIYTDLIGRFILKYETDEKIQSALMAIREGSILYIGLNHNINETGSLKKSLTLFLGTEVLFSLYGFNGEIYKDLALDLYKQIEVANGEKKRVHLRFFSDIRKEIDGFFGSAEQIVDGKEKLFDTVAMRAIINGCSTSGDVKVRKSDFFHTLQYQYGIIEDEKNDYYNTDDEMYNLEDLSADPQMHSSIKLISHINKLRKGKSFADILDSEYLIVTNSGNTLRASREQVKCVKKNNVFEEGSEYAISVERLTNILWYKMGNGLGGKEYPTNVNAVLKARLLLASKISQEISKLYTDTKSQFIAGEITEEQLVSRIITLRKKPTTPDELSHDTIDESLNFSIEYLARYEEEVGRSKEVLQEKDRLLKALHEENEMIRLQKDNVLAEKERQIQEQQTKTAILEAELAEYHRRDEEKEARRRRMKKSLRMIMGITLRLFVIAIILVATVYICGRIDSSITTAVSLFVGIIGSIPVVIYFIKEYIKKEY